jgi:hypothetical protein
MEGRADLSGDFSSSLASSSITFKGPALISSSDLLLLALSSLIGYSGTFLVASLLPLSLSYSKQIFSFV